MVSRILLVVLGLAAVALAAPVVLSGRTQNTQPEQLENYTFDDWVAEYKRPHLLGAAYRTNTEFAKRKAIFEANLATIKKHNANPKRSWTMNMNQFGDQTVEEFLSKMTGYNKGMGIKSRKASNGVLGAPEFPRVQTGKSYPASVDWRNKGVTTPIKNQGQCGSCWAFASTATYESHAAIATGQLVVLSPQQLTSCTPNPKHCGGTGGCAGATCELAFDYWAKAGATTNELYPYSSGSSGQTGNCRYNASSMPPAFKSTGYIQLPTNDVDAHLEAIQKGPLGISVAANNFMFYSSGIFDQCNDADVNHAVVMEGYGEENGKKYWIVRNSWGPSWGERGYIRMIRPDTEACMTDSTPLDGSGCEGGPSEITVCGCVGLLSDSSYPTGITLA